MSKVVVNVVLDPQKLGYLLMHGAIKTITKEFDIDTRKNSYKLIIPIDAQKHNFVDVFIEKSGAEENKSE